MKAEERLRQMMLQQCRELDCIHPGDTICCALSGGADSVCLLRCLLELQPVLEISLTAVHVNHHLRGAESDRDADFCRQLCETYHVPLTVLEVEVRQYATAHQVSEELAARKCRYAAFSEVEADWIATAHTASDNLETLVHRLVRGAGLHGLCAIPPRNGRFLRPLLSVTRHQVEAYLEALGQTYVTDSTNLTDAYTRNRIRHQVVPELQKLNSSVEQTASRTIRGLRRDAAYLEQQAQTAYAQCHSAADTLTGLEELPPALQIRCIAMLLQENGFSYDAALLERLLQISETGGKWNLSGDAFFTANGGLLKLERRQKSPQKPQPVKLQLGENVLYLGCVVKASIFTGETAEKIAIIQKKFANSCVDYDKIKGDLFLHPREPGAKLQLCGCSFTSSLKKRIQEKVPRAIRSTLHLLYDAEGIVYAEKIGIADRVRPDAATRRLLVLEVVRNTMTQLEP